MRATSHSHQQLPLLSVADRVLFPRMYMRVAVTDAAALQLVRDLVAEVQGAVPRRLAAPDEDQPPTAPFALAIFTKRPASNSSSSDQAAGESTKAPAPSRTATDSHATSLATDDAAATHGVYSVGTIGRIVQISRVGNKGGLSLLLQGMHRIRLLQTVQTTPYPLVMVARVRVDMITCQDKPLPRGNQRDKLESIDKTLEVLAMKLKQLTQEYLQTSKNSTLLQKSSVLVNSISNASMGDLADVVTSYMDIDVVAKQSVLESKDIKSRCERTIELLTEAIERSKLEQKIQSEVQDKIEGTRKEFLLRQQLEAIKKELGESVEEDGANNDIKLLEERIQQLALEPKAAKVVHRELRRLKTMSAQQPEYGVIHNYLEFFAELPWNRVTEDHMCVDQVRTQLDADHYGLEKVKKRIIEYIAVRSLKNDMKGPILCLVGPPGVGKTSLGKSIALATNRQFERIALGGVHDESEIRGHRKTYVGAMPGCILNALRHAESRNPVLLLDEVDKIGKDFRGDPTSALLEVLDPHQNHTFTDHYLNVPFDLSSVMFVATANSLDTIPAPLLDRMEVIEVSGYSVEQKVEIAKRYLVRRQIEENGLDDHLIQIDDDVLRFLIMNYTREAGVRDLERQVGAICRYMAVSAVKQLGDTQSKSNDEIRAGLAAMAPVVVGKAMINTVLGHELVFNEVALRSSVPGVATGMSWSSVGGSILFVEASCSRHAEAALSSLDSSASAHPTNATLVPRLQLTGKLGDVMKESAQLALSWLRVNASAIELPKGQVRLSLDGISDVHVHFPEGAIPKDGPSAGAAIVCALLSVISGVAVPADLAMTGEITLRGVILPVGGIREKVMAAIRAGIKRIVLPRGNQKEAQELAREMATLRAGSGGQDDGMSGAKIVFVGDLRELVELVFGMKIHDDPNLRLNPFANDKEPMLLSML
ncbi:TPA: hypothetical protein N0F65_010165 [Lagenidium giganteum]|uniref:Lon protease homolog n=1 Tax=Lagenidium giganteum TaxID=4803 RepID=A0AAV2Z7B1_9STRA|nr:TPA: hypothetical protein N0F65_010165 [Lagenidium giganteum]